MNYNFYISELRYCSNCGEHKKPEGGKDKLSSNGLRRRWVCASCAKGKSDSWFGKKG